MPFQLRDRLSASAPITKHPVALDHESLKRVWGKANLGVAPSGFEENQSATDFNARRLLSEVTMLVHTRISCADSEQANNGLTFDKGKGILRPTSGRVS